MIKFWVVMGYKDMKNSAFAFVLGYAFLCELHRISDGIFLLDVAERVFRSSFLEEDAELRGKGLEFSLGEGDMVLNCHSVGGVHPLPPIVAESAKLYASIADFYVSGDHYLEKEEACD